MANEKRLIDANALYDKLKQHLELFVGAWKKFGLEIPRQEKSRIDEIVNCLAEVVNAPTVDAVQVVHGRWIPTYKVDWWMGTQSIDGYTCNQCARHFKRGSNYCPNCGAKMDGDGNA